MAKKYKKGKVKDEKSGGGSTKWSDADNALLVTTMATQKVEGYWGDNNLKSVAWTACERH